MELQTPVETVGGFLSSPLVRATTTIITCTKVTTEMVPVWYNFDPSKWLIWILSKLGLAYDLRRQSPS